MAEGNNQSSCVCKSCNAPLPDLTNECPGCGKPIDSATMLRIATERVVAREQRADMMPKLRDVFSGGPSISPAARAHFARSNVSGRIAALRAVQASGDSSEFPTAVLESYYKRSPADLRVEIIRTLGAAGSEASVQVLQRILDDEKDERVSRVFQQRMDDTGMDDITFPNLEVSPLQKAKTQPTTFEKEIAGMEGLPEPERPVSAPPPSIVAPGPSDETPVQEEIESITEEISLLEETGEQEQGGPAGPGPEVPPAEPAESEAEVIPESPTSQLQEDPKRPQPPPAPPAPPAAPAPPPAPSATPPPTPGPAAGSPEPEPPLEAALPEPSGKVALPGGPPLPELPRQPDLEQLSAEKPHPVAQPIEEKPRGSALRGCLLVGLGIVIGCIIGAGAVLGLSILGHGTLLLRPSEPPTEKPAEEASMVEQSGEDEEPAEEPGPEASEPVPVPTAAEAVKLTYTATASSSHKKYPPSNLYDGKNRTVWQEDRKTKAENQVLTFRFEKPVQVAKIGVVIGFNAKDRSKGDMWPLNNRLKTAVVKFPDGTKVVLDFEEDVREMQFKQIPSPGPVEEFTFKIIDCYRGSWFRDNAIPEIEIWGTP